PSQALGVLRGSVWLDELGHDRQGWCRQDRACHDRPLRGSYAGNSSMLHQQPGHWSTQTDSTASLPYSSRQLVGQHGKAAAIIGQHLLPTLPAASSPELELVPEPHGGNLGGVRPELSFQQGLPDDLIDLAATEASKPLFGSQILQFPPV